MHVVDATLFYSPTSGGVKRYLLAKHEWMRRTPIGATASSCPAKTRRTRRATSRPSPARSFPVPSTIGCRSIPLHWSRAIDALEPDLIEIGDAFHPAWAAASVANRRGIPLIAFYHSNFPQLAGRRLGQPACRNSSSGTCGSPTNAAGRCSRPAATCATTCTASASRHATCQPLGVDVDTFTPERRGRDLRAELNLPRGTRLLVFAGRFSAEKNIPVLTEAMRRLGSPYHLLLIGGGEAHARRQRHAHPVLPRQSRARELLRLGRRVRACRHRTKPSVSWCSRRWPAAVRWSPCAPARFRSSWMRARACSPSRTETRMSQPRISPSAVADVYQRDLDVLGAAARAPRGR